MNWLISDIDHELVDMSGHKVTARISIQLNLEIESPIEFMKTVDEDFSHPATVRVGNPALATTGTTIAEKIGTVLQYTVQLRASPNC